MITHESYIQRVANIAIDRLPRQEDQVRLRAIKLTYGAGPEGVRGITYFQRWKGAPDASEPLPFVGINAMCQDDPIQLAGTTIHELGHVLAGWGAAHGPDWKAACEALGLRRIKAAGTLYKRAMFAADVRMAIAGLKLPTDGQPVCSLDGVLRKTGNRMVIKPCAAGTGTKGGKSRGKGSGSRLLKFQCSGIGHPATIARASAGANFQATCNHCQTLFQLAD